MAASPSPSPRTDDVDDGEHLGIGATLDNRYRIDALIGTGGMGRIYRAEHTRIGRAVAIKVLHNDLNHNREAAQRFQREAVASARLDHPNIVGIYDFGELPHGACYLVMELLEGESLGARLERDGRISWAEALKIMREMLLGLRHAHDRGVVHRDIKPDNIYLARKDGDLIVKILDFGIAKLRAGSADDPASTRAGLTVGTPAYLSPEQAVGGEITPASDLYSASIVLYEMIAGRGPFADKDPLAMLGAHVSRTPPSISEVAPGVEVPPGLEAMVQAGLLKASAERTRSAKEYIGLIDRLVEQMRRYRTGPVMVPRAGDLAAAAQGLPFTPAHGAPVVSPDQSIMISVEPYTPLGEAATQPMPTRMSDPSLPLQARAVSVAEVSEPIPRRWFVIGGIVIVILIIGAIILAVSSSGNYKPSSAPTSGVTPMTPPSVVMTVPAPPAAAAVDPELKLKALLHDLQNGRTCALRRAAIAPLVELGDRRAIEPLRAARYRMQGGFAGFGADNVNACLTREAEAAIKSLSAQVKQG